MINIWARSAIATNRYKKEGKMKRILFAILIIFLWCGVSWGAASITETVKKFSNPKGEFKYKVTLACTSHTDNSFSVALSTDLVQLLDGFYVYSITSYPGGTAPTDNTDLVWTVAKTGTTKSVDILGTNGTDFIDATTTKELMTHQAFSSLNFYHVMDSDNTYTLTTSNNAVASATFVLEMVFVDR